MPRNKSNIVTISTPSVQVVILKYHLLLKKSKFLKEMVIPAVEQKMYKGFLLWVMKISKIDAQLL